MKIHNLTASMLLAVVALSGCTSVKPIYYKDGSLALVTSCTGSSWLECYESAGKKCGVSGYKILEKMSNSDIGYLGSLNENKDMLFACKAIQEVKEIKDLKDAKEPNGSTVVKENLPKE